MTVEIRPSTVEDVDAVRELRLHALLNEPDAFGSTYEESIGRERARWVEMATAWNYYVAWDGDIAIGMASGGMFPPRPDSRWLYGMFVRTTYRGSGVAVALVHAVAEWARDQGVGTLGLHVTTTVPRAVRFYEKLGFVPEGLPEPMERDPRLLLQTMVADLRTNDRF